MYGEIWKILMPADVIPMRMGCNDVNRQVGQIFDYLFDICNA